MRNRIKYFYVGSLIHFDRGTRLSNEQGNKLNLVVEQDLDGGAASTVYDDDTILDGGGA